MEDAAEDKVVVLKHHGLGTRRIAGKLGVARSTVIKALRSEEATA